jgi:hypothetical protein
VWGGWRRGCFGCGERLKQVKWFLFKICVDGRYLGWDICVTCYITRYIS